MVRKIFDEVKDFLLAFLLGIVVMLLIDKFYKKDEPKIIKDDKVIQDIRSEDDSSVVNRFKKYYGTNGGR